MAGLPYGCLGPHCHLIDLTTGEHVGSHEHDNGVNTEETHMANNLAPGEMGDGPCRDCGCDCEADDCWCTMMECLFCQEAGCRQPWLDNGF